MRTSGFAAPLIFFTSLLQAHADTIHLKDGYAFHGVVAAENPKTIVVRFKASGTIIVQKADIVGIDQDAEDIAALPRWDTLLKAAMQTDWGKSIEQIPATVIDVGVLKDVPYLSYAAGNYEMNIYGDPDLPAGIEIGVYRESSTDARPEAL